MRVDPDALHRLADDARRGGHPNAPQFAAEAAAVRTALLLADEARGRGDAAGVAECEHLAEAAAARFRELLR